MEDYNRNALEFLKSTFMGRGLRFAIQTLPLSFRTTKFKEKEKTKREIYSRLNKDHTKKSCKRFFYGEIKVELYCNFNRRYSTTDVDNISKFVLDCMKELAFKDDKQIKELVVKKIKCSKGAKEYIGVGISKV